VSEITSGIRTRRHSLTPWAKVNGIAITYPHLAAADQSRGIVARHDRRLARR